MKKPTISIIIPVYNAEHTVARMVESVLRQTFKDFELILVNDGSSDGSTEILANFAKTDQRVVVINQKNAGPAVARNTGLGKASGKFVMFFDADDEVEPNMLAEMVQAIDGADLAVCGWQEIYDDKIKDLSFQTEIMSGDLNPQILKSLGSDGKFYGIWNKIYRRSLIKKHQIHFPTDLRFGEDLLFNFEYYRHVQKIRVLDKILYKYHISGQSLFSTSSLDFAARQRNENALLAFAESANQSLAIWVQTKWFIQFLLALLRSDLPKAEAKKRFFEAAAQEKISNIKNPSQLSKSQLLLIKLVKNLQKAPSLLYILIKMIAKTRKGA
jgi:glycosyltransferase involved in cell wall biosynthesis